MFGALTRNLVHHPLTKKLVRHRGQDGVRKRSRFLKLESLEARALLTLVNPIWISQGPGPVDEGGAVQATGAIQAAAVDPNNADRVFIAAVDGGVWRTTNATAASPTWTPLTDQQPFLGMSDIAFSPLDATGNTLFTATGRVSSTSAQPGPSVGLYRTTNGGGTGAPADWTQLGQTTFGGLTISSLLPTAVVVSGAGTPSDRQVILVGTQGGPNSGLYRSADGGMTWTQISGNNQPGNRLPPGNVNQVVRDSGDPTAMRFYAAVPGQGIFLSTDAGQTWTAANGTGDNQLINLAGTGRIRLAVQNNPNNPNNVLYAGLVVNNRLASIFRSPDQGATWTAMALPGDPVQSINSIAQANLHFSIAADPNNANIVFVGGDSNPKGYNGILFRGDAGQPAANQWTTIVQAGANNTSPHSDSRNMVFDPNGNILEVDDGGIYRLTNPNADPMKPTRQWAPLNGNLSAIELNAVAYDSVNHVVFGGAQDNGTPQQNAADSLPALDVSSGDGANSQVDNISMPGYSIHYVTTQSSMARIIYNGANVPDAPPQTTELKLPVNTVGQPLRTFDKTAGAFLPFVVNNVQGSRLLFGTTFLYESIDRGNSLTALGGINNGQPQGAVGNVTALAYGGRFMGQDNPDVAYVGTDTPSLLLRQTSPGTPTGTFEAVASYPGSTPKGIAMDPDNWKTVYVIDDQDRVWRAADAANPVWVNLTANLATLGAKSFQSIAIFGNTSNPNDEVIFVAALNGVYGTDNPAAANGAAAWTRFGTGLPNVLVTAVSYDATDNVLVAGTLGRGYWKVSTLTNFAGNQAPVLSPGTATTTFTAGATAIAVAPNNLTLVDADDTNLRGATIVVTNPLDGNNEGLAVSTAGTNITAGAYDPTSGRLLLTGMDSLANYQNVLRSATYNDTATNPTGTVRIISMTVTDGVAGSNRSTTTVTIVPAAGTAAPAVLDNTTPAVMFTADGNPIAVARQVFIRDTSTNRLDSATVTLVNPHDGSDETLAADTSGTPITAAFDPFRGILTLSGADTLANYQTVLRSVTYDDAALVPDEGIREITITLNDGTHRSLQYPVEVEIAPVNHAPVLDSGATFRLNTINENATSNFGTSVSNLIETASSGVAITDPDPNAARGIAVVGVDDSHGTWQFSLDAGGTWQNFVKPSATESTLLTDDAGTAVRFVPDADFNGTVAVGLAFRAWDRTSGEPRGLAMQQDVNGTVADTSQNGGNSPFSSATAAAGVSITFVNQAPSFGKGPDLKMNSAAGAEVFTAWVNNFSAGPVHEAGQQLTFLVSNNNNAFFLAQPAIAAGGTLAFTPTPEAFGTATVAVRLRDDGGTANGGLDTSAAQTFTITLGTPNQYFVAQLYRDLLQREIDLAGLDYWIHLLNQTHSRAAIVDSIIHSREHHELQVKQQYKDLLIRDADDEGLAFHTAFLEAGGSLEELKARILGSDEFLQRHGGNANGFDAALAHDLLFREVDTTLSAFLEGVRARGASREEAARTLLASVEARRAVVHNSYQAVLGLRPDLGGLTYFVGRFANGAHDDDVLATLVESDEYFSRS